MKKTLLGMLLVGAKITACNNNNTDTTSKSLIVATDNSSVKHQCPMKCEGDTAYTTTGTCPVCEMDLEKIN